MLTGTRPSCVRWTQAAGGCSAEIGSIAPEQPHRTWADHISSEWVAGESVAFSIRALLEESRKAFEIRRFKGFSLFHRYDFSSFLPPIRLLRNINQPNGCKEISIVRMYGARSFLLLYTRLAFSVVLRLDCLPNICKPTDRDLIQYWIQVAVFFVPRYIFTGQVKWKNKERRQTKWATAKWSQWRTQSWYGGIDDCTESWSRVSIVRQKRLA